MRNKTWNMDRNLRDLRQRFHGVMHATTVMAIIGMGNYCFGVEVIRLEYIRISPYLFSRQEIHSATMVKNIKNTHLLLGCFDDNFRFQTFKLRHAKRANFSAIQTIHHLSEMDKAQNQNTAYLRDWPIKWFDIDRVTKDHRKRRGKVESLHNNTLHRGRFLTLLLEGLSMLVAPTFSYKPCDQYIKEVVASNYYIIWSRYWAILLILAVQKAEHSKWARTQTGEISTKITKTTLINLYILPTFFLHEFCAAITGLASHGLARRPRASRERVWETYTGRTSTLGTDHYFFEVWAISKIKFPAQQRRLKKENCARGAMRK